MGKRLRYFDENKRIIPYTKSLYEKNPHNGKWVLKSREKGMTSRAILKAEIKARTVLPFEDMHRKTKQQRYQHDLPFDTIASYKGNKKSVMEYDVAQGERNYQKLARKSRYDRERYLKKKRK